MASTYVNNLRLNEMATGDQSGSWGTVTNLNLELIGEALGWGTRAIANASTDNITIADGAADADRSMALKLTGGGQACTITLLPNTVSKVWIMENATAATLTFTAGSGANVAILAGETKMIATDGGGSGGVVYDVLTDLNLAGTTKTAALTNAGALSNQGTVTVGVDDTGHDVKFFGATSGKYMLWDESADALLVSGSSVKVAGKETIYIPATAMYPSSTNGCSSLTQVETTALRPDLMALDFATGSDEFAQFSIAFPKSWNEGTVTFQPFWTVTGTNTGTVAWGLSGISVSNDGSINTAFGTTVVCTALGFSGTSNDLMVSAESGAVTIAGSPAANDMCFFQVSRDVSADNQSGDARLLGIKVFFTTDAENDA